MTATTGKHTFRKNNEGKNDDKHLISLLRELAQEERAKGKYNLLKHQERVLLGYIDSKKTYKKNGATKRKLRLHNRRISKQKEVALKEATSIRERHREEVINNDN